MTDQTKRDQEAAEKFAEKYAEKFALVGDSISPEECARRGVLEGIAHERARTQRLEDILRWLRDGIQHFTADEDQGQVNHLIKRIDEALKEGGGEHE